MMQAVSVLSDSTSLTVRENGSVKHYPRCSLPRDFIEWQIQQRRSIFDHLRTGGKPTFLPSHLPALITIPKDQHDFPVNVACKGVGLVPKDNGLASLTAQLKQVLQEIENKPFQSSLASRIDGAMLLYSNVQKIHPSCLGGLEIFEANSFQNILQNPQVSLYFVGGAPVYKSYQMNCIAEIIKPTESFYQFVISMRSLFEEAEFHFQQPKYPYAIKYHVIQVIDKSLKVRGQ